MSPWDVLAPLLSVIPVRACYNPLGLFPVCNDALLLFGQVPVLVERFDSVLGTPGLLSRACTGSILNMVHRAPLVSNNLLFDLYAEVCEMGRISSHTNQTSPYNK